MAEPHIKPRCPYCEHVFARLGMWTDTLGLSAIFFCPHCGKAFGAQLLRPPLPAEDREENDDQG
jgi:uncharacterized Zn-finger protein